MSGNEAYGSNLNTFRNEAHTLATERGVVELDHEGQSMESASVHEYDDVPDQ